MLVLLPPSEGKAAGGSGPALDLEGLSLPALNPARTRVLEELVALCSGDAEKAREVLGLGVRQAAETGRNAALRTAPALPAAELYTGVLYDHLDLAGLTPAARRRAAASLRVFSGLWGVLRVDDAVPPYRCSGGVKLPGTGALGAYWRGPLAEALPREAGDGLVLDLRSSAYAAMWKPEGDLAGRTATVRVLHARTVDGVEKRSVVSHFNKATKGRLVRALLESGAEPRDPRELVDVLREMGHRVEAEPPARAGRPWALDLVVSEI